MVDEEKIVGLNECPHCHEAATQAIAPDFSESRRQEAVRYRCRKCGATWRAVYRFVSIEDLSVVSVAPKTS